MTVAFENEITYGGAYWPNQALIGENVPNTLIEGSKNFWVEGPGRLRSWGGPATFANYGNDVMGLVGNKIFTMGSGSACQFIGNSIWYIGNPIGIGSFDVIVDGTVIGTATSQLQYRLANNNNGIAGLIAPTTAPVLSASGTDATKLQVGTYSIKETYINTDTNGEGNAGPVSNIYTVGSPVKQITATFVPPGAGTVPVNTQRNIYVSRVGFPQGPWYFLKRIPSSATSTTLDFVNGDTLDDKAPNDHFPPLRGTHVFALGDLMIIAGVNPTGGAGFGAGIMPSIPGKPDSYNYELITELNPSEPILGIRGRPGDGWQYVFCRNSLHAVIFSGGFNLIEVRAIWSEMGIANMNAAAFVGGEFYGYSGKRLACRTTAGNNTAEPDTTFALPIESDMASWNPDNVVVGYSQDDDAVVYFHGNMAWCYKRKLQQWSTPFVLADAGVTGNVTSCVQYQGKLIFAIGSNMYEFSGGSSNTITAVAVPVWRDGGAAGFDKTITSWITAYDVGASTLTSELLTNFVTNSVKSSQMTTGSSASFTKWKKCNVKKAKVFTVRHTVTGGNKYVYQTHIMGGISRIRV